MNKLEKMRDELAEKRAMKQCSSGCEHTDKVWQRHLRIGFEDGFSACDAHYRPIVEELVKALELIGKVKYGLELSDYDNMEYVADYWAKKSMHYESLARQALESVRRKL